MDSAMRDYMAATIRAHTGRPLDGWSDDEIRGTFWLVGRPAMTYDQWRAIMGEPAAQEPAAAPQPDPNQPHDATESDVAMIMSMIPQARKVETA